MDEAPTGGSALGGGEHALRGLTDDEVADRVREGKVNANVDVRTKTVGQILREHTLTLFNGVNVVLAALVVTTGSYRNLTFMVVVVANLVISVFQEIRAKRKVDKLTILMARDVRVLRNGEQRLVPMDEVVLDDLVLLAHGDQVPADGVVEVGSPRMDESLITGESAAVEKGVGDEVFSGSFVEMGSFAYRVTRVGKDGYAARINAEAKYLKPVRSEILATLRTIIGIGTSLLIPLGAGLFLRILLSPGYGYSEAVLQSVAAVVGMIPQGLVLLTSGVLAIATTRLASHKVLVQQSYTVEMLARVDVLCLDKTGTITTGDMEVSDVRGDAAVAAATIATANLGDANETARAVLRYARDHDVAPLATRRAVPFSSDTKFSGCVTLGGASLVMGAAQFVMGERFPEVEGEVRSFGSTERVLVVARVDGFDDAGRILGNPEVIGYLGIRDRIRKSASRTMEYFREQGVGIRVISGDDPVTVSSIAASVGVPDADRYVDASTLDTEEKIADAALRYRVFGRVTPQVKRELVCRLREQGHTVAMTGDGVNDVLALREADCSVAMAAGSAAARNVAEIVLVDNDFAHMPEVVAEGRRSINNLQRSASLFLMKTVYSAVLALICIIMPPYPFIPVQMSLVSLAIIGVPSFLLALEPNHDRVRGSFIENVLKKSLPASGAIICALLAVIVIARVRGWSDGVMSTVCMLQMFAVGIVLIFRISQPLNPLRVAVLALVGAMVTVGVTVFGWFFKITIPSTNSMVVAVVVAVMAIILFNRLYDESQSGTGPVGYVMRYLVRKNRERLYG